MDIVYWDNFYKTNLMYKTPSSFALFVGEQYLKKKKKLIDLGCGNGRDSIFFNKNYDIVTTGLDQSKIIIDALQHKYENNNLKFIVGDFYKLHLLEDTYDYVYSRFSLHSVPEEGENCILKFAQHNINPGGYLFIEARSIKDPKLLNSGTKISINENIEDNHYRRYIDINNLLEKIKKLGFDIIYTLESNNLSIYKNDNPVLIRIVAQESR